MTANLRLLVLGTLLVLVSLVSSAQIKVRERAQIWPELQADFNLDNQSFFFFRSEYRFLTGPASGGLSEEGVLKNLHQLQVQVGYEHLLSERWSGGASARYAHQSSAEVLFSEVFLRHSGDLLGLRFIKRFSLEHLTKPGTDNSGRGRLLLELERQLSVFNGKVFRPRVSYELFREFAFAPDDNQVNAGRNIDRTRLRLDLSFEVNRHLFLLPYFTRQTDYYVLEPQFDDRGNVVRPGGKHNFIVPIGGLGIRYNLYQSESAVSPRHR